MVQWWAVPLYISGRWVQDAVATHPATQPWDKHKRVQRGVGGLRHDDDVNGIVLRVCVCACVRAFMRARAQARGLRVRAWFARVPCAWLVLRHHPLPERSCVVVWTWSGAERSDVHERRRAASLDANANRMAHQVVHWPRGVSCWRRDLVCEGNARHHSERIRLGSDEGRIATIPTRFSKPRGTRYQCV